MIVVDDGSTEPDTRRGARPRCRRACELIRQANAGLSAARNAGLREATTPYLIVLDADDKLAPVALRTLKAALIADERSASPTA